MLARGRSRKFLYGNPEVNVTSRLVLLHRKEVKLGQFFGTVDLSKLPL